MSHDNENVRWKQRFQNFERVYFQLEHALNVSPLSDLEQAGMVQFFELTFELAWKLLKDHLEELGFSPKSPKETLKQAFQSGLIEEGHAWIDALADRNLTTHTYDAETAMVVEAKIRHDYFPLLEKLYNSFNDKIDK